MMIDDVQYFTQSSGLKTAYRHTQGSDAGFATLVFLPGYMSDMDGSKACALFDYAQQNNHSCLLLDYSGCGKSEGDFINATLSIWCEEVCALIADKTNGPIILVGSSMGGWLMLLVALQLIEINGTGILRGMIGIAAAPDFTDWDFNASDKAEIQNKGTLYRDNDYGYDPTPMHQKFHQDGQDNLMLTNAINIHCPVALFHGQNDGDVPFEISLQLSQSLCSSAVHVHLIKDADHRFSRDSDIKILIDAAANLWKII